MIRSLTLAATVDQQTTVAGNSHKRCVGTTNLIEVNSVTKTM
jgi:hypothetical protein